jgi:hypothetical protein
MLHMLVSVNFQSYTLRNKKKRRKMNFMFFMPYLLIFHGVGEGS